MVDLAYREWIFNIKNINELEQVSIKEKESSPPLQKFFLLPQKIIRMKILKQIKLKNKWALNRKENEKTLKIIIIKKKNLEKRLKTNRWK